MTGHTIEHVGVGLGVLAFSFFIEGYSLRVAYLECCEEAEKLNMTVKEYIMSGYVCICVCMHVCLCECMHVASSI